MKINTPKNNHKTVITISIVIAVLVAAGLVYSFTRNNNRTLTKQNDKTSSVQKDQTIDTQNNESNDVASEKTNLPSKNGNTTLSDDSIRKQKTDVPTPTKAPEKPTLARASQKDDKIKIVATLKLTSPGYCEAVLTKAGQKTVSRESNVVVGPSYYACDFIIPTSALSSNGVWNVTVLHHVGNAKTASNVNTVEVK